MNWFSSCDITTSLQVWTSWFFRWEASRETFCLQRVCLTGFNTDMWSVEYQLNREGHFLELTIVFKDCGPFYVRCLWRFRLPWHWRHPLQHQRTSEEICKSEHYHQQTIEEKYIFEHSSVLVHFWCIFNVQEPGTTEYNRLVKVSQTCVSQKNTNKRVVASS